MTARAVSWGQLSAGQEKAGGEPSALPREASAPPHEDQSRRPHAHHRDVDAEMTHGLLRIMLRN